MAELGFEEALRIEEVRGADPRPLGFDGSNQGLSGGNASSILNLAAITRAQPTTNRNEYMVCWNCDDLGHSFQDLLWMRREGSIQAQLR